MTISHHPSPVQSCISIISIIIITTNIIIIIIITTNIIIIIRNSIILAGWGFQVLCCQCPLLSEGCP